MDGISAVAPKKITRPRKPALPPFEIGGKAILPGERVTVHLPAARLYTFTEMHVPVHVIRGNSPGPTLFVSAAIHGDEVQGVEIVRQLLSLKRLRRLRGTLLAVPIVNVYGFTNHSRYLPDRRDLNRSFPGSAKGSLGSSLARTFMDEIVGPAQYGIDLHTGSNHRMNLPQIRVNLDDPEARALALAFGAPLVLDASLRDGSLRQAGAEDGTRVLVYEAGEALRLDPLSIRIGVHGVISVMEKVGMLSKPSKSRKAKQVEPLESHSSYWLRAPASGLFRAGTRLGARVAKGDEVGHIIDPFGESSHPIIVREGGLIIGKTNLPMSHRGDALYHIARLDADSDAASTFEAVKEIHDPEHGDPSLPLDDEGVWSPYEFLEE